MSKKKSLQDPLYAGESSEPDTLQYQRNTLRIIGGVVGSRQPDAAYLGPGLPQRAMDRPSHYLLETQTEEHHGKDQQLKTAAAEDSESNGQCGKLEFIRSGENN